MSYIVKNGKPVYIGRNVKLTPVISGLKEKRNAQLSDEHILGDIEAFDSRRFLSEALDDPIAFTYSLWRLFGDEPVKAVNTLCNFAIEGNGKDLLKALEIVLFDAAPKINAFCLNYIISQISVYIDSDSEKVKKAIEKMLWADFPLACKIVVRIYKESPLVTKEIADKLIVSKRMKLFKMLVKPVLKLNT